MIQMSERLMLYLNVECNADSKYLTNMQIHNPA